MELIKDGDRIVLQTKRSPVTYFNRSDSVDKGQFFKFLLQRSPNFYDAIRSGLESIDRSYAHLGPIREKPGVRRAISLEERYHIGPLTHSNYLTHERGFDQATLDSKAFRGRLFNAFHINDNQSRIANVAVPKYGLDGMVKNYTLYNRPYRDRRDGKMKKFRLLLNERYEYLFVSDPGLKAERIVCFESAFDAMAYHELHGGPDCFYVSLSGHIDERKLDQFFQWEQVVDRNRDLPLHLGFDHDLEGMRYDLKLLSAWLNRKSETVHMDVSWKRPVSIVRLNYISYPLERMERDTTRLNAMVEGMFHGFPKGMKKAICFRDKVIWELDLEKILGLGGASNISRAYWKTVVDGLSQLYADGKVTMDKSPSQKDWNEELVQVKKMLLLNMEKLADIGEGYDVHIELKADMGPEGAPPIGKMVRLSDKGICCDFGLRHTYMIPMQSVKHCYAVKANTVSKEKKQKIGRHAG